MIKRQIKNFFIFISFFSKNSIARKAFDPQFYSKTYGVKYFPFLHFLTSGLKRRNSPCKEFDVAAYVTSNPDLQNCNPIVHYFNHGFFEGREITAVSSHLTEKDFPLKTAKSELEKIQIRGSKLTNHCVRWGGVIVYIHLFYRDVFPEIINYLRHINFPFSLAISVFSDKDKELVTQELTHNRKKLKLQNFYIKVAKNRGRNFGPFLVEFREIIKLYDFVLHIHTKKSLRTGEEQSKWRESLFRGLLGNNFLYPYSILNLFKKYPNVGLIFPESIEGSDWWNHWLDSSRISWLAETLEFKHPITSNKHFLLFPVGGMFWARTSALTDLLNHDWKYEEFEPEPIGDGYSLPHTLEHAMGKIVKQKGYQSICVDTIHYTYRVDSSKFNLQEYPSIRSQALYSIANADIVSFDFYDTLFCRLCTVPEDIPNFIGFVLEKEKFLSKDSAQNFKAYRSQAEHLAREKHSFKIDVSLDQIYEAMESMDIASLASPVIRRAKELELAIEERVLRPRKDVLELVKEAKKAKKEVWLTSDSYMPKEFFKKILEQHGLETYFDKLYISNDINKRKDSRDIWRFYKTLTPKKIVHLGDNQESDVHGSVVNGLAAIYLMSAPSIAEIRDVPMARGWSLQGFSNWEEGILYGPTIARLCSNAFCENISSRVRISSLEDLGYVFFGPVLVNFINWITSEAKRNHIKKLFFVSREGYFLQKIYDRISQYSKDFNAPKSDYFLMSRSVALLCSMANSFDPTTVVERGTFQNQTFGDFLLKRLGIAEKDLTINKKLAQIPVNLPGDEELVKRLCWLVKHDIEMRASVQKGLLEQYILSIGYSIADYSESAFVDIGYAGTIQRALQKALSAPLNWFYFSTERCALKILEEGGRFNSYLDYLADSPHLSQWSMMFEAFLTSPNGSLQFFESSAEGKIKPVFGNNQCADFNVLNKIADGVFDYVEDLYSSYGCEVFSIVLNPDAINDYLSYFKDGRIQISHEILNQLVVETAYNGGEDVVKVRDIL